MIRKIVRFLMGLGFCLKLASHRALRGGLLCCCCATEILGVKFNGDCWREINEFSSSFSLIYARVKLPSAKIGKSVKNDRKDGIGERTKTYPRGF